MTLRTGSGRPRDVAVGTTREEAAEVFGEHFDDVFFTAYEDFDAEVDLSLLRSVGLVAGDGLSAVLPRVLARDNMPGTSAMHVLVGLPAAVDHRDTARRVLAAHPSVAFTAVLRAGEHPLLLLGRADEAAGDEREEILAELSVTGAPPAPVLRTSKDPDRPLEAVGASAPPRGGRWRALVLAAVAALAAVVTGVSLVGLALGTEALLFSVVMVVAVSQVVLVVGILYVVRLLRHLSREIGEQGRNDAEFRAQMHRRTDRLVRLQRQELAAGQKTRAEVVRTRNRVMALGKLLGRSAAAAREDQRPAAR